MCMNERLDYNNNHFNNQVEIGRPIYVLFSGTVQGGGGRDVHTNNNSIIGRLTVCVCAHGRRVAARFIIGIVRVGADACSHTCAHASTCSHD
jgi:hypothetical protein